MFLILKSFSESTAVLLAIIFSICTNLKVAAGEQIEKHTVYATNNCDDSKGTPFLRVEFNQSTLLLHISGKSLDYRHSGPFIANAFLVEENCTEANVMDCPAHTQVSMSFNNSDQDEPPQLLVLPATQAAAAIYMPEIPSPNGASVEIQFDPVQGLGSSSLTCNPDGKCNNVGNNTILPPNFEITSNIANLNLNVTFCP